MHRGGIRRHNPIDDHDDGEAAGWGDYRGGHRGSWRGQGRGRSRGGRGGGRPSGLTGKEIGLWYAARGRARSKAKEVKERHVVAIDDHDKKKIRSLLGKNSDSSDGEEDIKHEQLEDEEVCFDQTIPTHLLTAAAQTDNQMSFEATTCSLQNDETFNQWLESDLQSKKEHSEKFQKLLEFRRNLPSYKMKEVILETIRGNQVIVISGETGCGKTTQVSQFILDDAIESGRGSQCHIICTQPRRISAISVADRVAAERGEKCGEGGVGFQIRLEKQLPRNKGSILYCTTGVLLRRLITDPLLCEVSHIVLDEIHERDLFSDFLIIILKDLLPLRPDMKLILMSATLNSEMFSEYFHSCPKINIPGFTYPVQEYHLEDVYEMLRYSPNVQNSKRYEKPRYKRPSREVEMKKEEEKRNLYRYLQNPPNGQHYSHHTIESLCEADLEAIDLKLIMSLTQYICSHMEDGAILIFLPGWDDISKLNDLLQASPVFRSRGYNIIPLHSLMPTKCQQQVFDRPPPGVRKIIIATNIAETSITIDDVVFVINSGKIKEKTYDTALNISCLQPVWASKASSKQRRGRAGRVQPGHCFHLFTRCKEDSLSEYQLPEILRTPLEELCLQIKILKLGKIDPFLAKALQSPSPESLHNAIRSLTELNALDVNENLTPLGYHLASLPVNPKVGKMILFGAIFSCLDPVLTVASSLGFKDPFFIPLSKEKEADAVRRKFADGAKSDHIMLVKAFSQWEKLRGTRQEKDWCWRNFLSMNTLNMIENMKSQFARLLHQIGFVDSPNADNWQANFHSENTKLVTAVICAGLYPNVAKVSNPHNDRRMPSLLCKEYGRVRLHPKSVNCQVKHFECHWMVYHEIMKTSGIFLYDTSMIAPFPLLFFGGKITMGREDFQNVIKIDDWIKFRASPEIAKLVKELRLKLDDLLEQKISNPNLKLIAGKSQINDQGHLLNAIIGLITKEEVQPGNR